MTLQWLAHARWTALVYHTSGTPSLNSEIFPKVIPEWVEQGLKDAPDVMVNENNHKVAWLVCNSVQTHAKELQQLKMQMYKKDYACFLTLLTPNTTAVTQACDASKFAALKDGFEGGALSRVRFCGEV